MQEFDHFYSYWNKDEGPSLKDISLKIKKNKFYGLVGAVGSGKSTLLQTIIREVPYFKGRFEVYGKVSYF